MIEQFFTMRGDIQRATRVPDDKGGSTLQWVTIMTSNGILDQLSGGERAVAMKMSEESSHIWICSAFQLVMTDPNEQTEYFGSPFAPMVTGTEWTVPPVDIKHTDRILINGAQYSIVDIDNPMNMGHHLEVTLNRVRNGSTL